MMCLLYEFTDKCLWGRKFNFYNDFADKDSCTGVDSKKCVICASCGSVFGGRQYAAECDYSVLTEGMAIGTILGRTLVMASSLSNRFCKKYL